MKYRNTHPRTWRAAFAAALLVYFPAIAQMPSSPVAAHDFVIVPPSNEGARSGGRLLSIWCPGPVAGPNIYQWVFRVPPEVPSPVRSIGFRRADTLATQPSATPAFNVTLNAWMGHAARPPHALEYVYARNRSSDRRQVANQMTVSMPTVQWRPDGIYSFDYRIPLSAPLTLTGGADGLIEFQLLDSTLCNRFLPDWLGLFEMYEPTTPAGFRNGSSVVVGTGCAPVGRTALQPTAIADAPLAGNHAGTFTWLMQNDTRVSGVRTFVFAGTSDVSWNGMSLPWSLSSSGAPGCSLYTGLEWQLPLVSDFPAPNALALLVVPNDPGLVGMHLWLQGIRTHPTFNPLGIVTTNAVRIRILPHLAASMGNCYWPPTPSFNSPGVATGVGLGGPVLMLDGR